MNISKIKYKFEFLKSSINTSFALKVQGNGIFYSSNFNIYNFLWSATSTFKRQFSFKLNYLKSSKLCYVKRFVT